jgi:hypothetical protein
MVPSTIILDPLPRSGTSGQDKGGCSRGHQMGSKPSCHRKAEAVTIACELAVPHSALLSERPSHFLLPPLAVKLLVLPAGMAWSSAAAVSSSADAHTLFICPLWSSYRQASGSSC